MRYRLACCTIVLTIAATGGQAQERRTGRIVFGPLAVGFRVVCDTAGRTAPVNERLHIWYPARRPRAGTPMRFSEYLAPTRMTDCGDPAATDEQRTAEIDAFARWIAPQWGFGDEPIGGRMFPTDSASSIAGRLALTTTHAFANPDPIAGKYPIVVFVPVGAITQSTLLESIASHGYVVTSIPPRAVTEVARTGSESSRDRHLWMAEEIGRAIAAVSRLPSADPNRIVVMAGSSWVGAAIWYHLQTGRLSALIADGGRFPGAPGRPRLEDSLPADFVSRWTIPVLDLTYWKHTGSRGVLDSLRRGERIHLLELVPHPNADGIRRLVYPGDTVVSTANDIVGRYVQQFLFYAIEHRAGSSAFFDRPAESNGVPKGLLWVVREMASR